MSSPDQPKLWTETTKIGHIFRKQSATLKIKVNLLVKYALQKKNNKALVDFWCRKMTLKVHISNFANFEEVVHNFGRSDDDMI